MFRATGLKSFSPVILDFFGMGMMLECLKHEGTLRSSSDLLKIFVKMVASWSAQDYIIRFFRVEERGVAGGVSGCVERCSWHVWGVFSNLQ